MKHSQIIAKFVSLCVFQRKTFENERFLQIRRLSLRNLFFIVELSLYVTQPSEEYLNYQCREMQQDVYRSINWPEPAYSFLLCIKYAFQRQ